MIFNIDLNTLATLGVAGLVSWALKGINCINRRLNEMNGNIRELKIWKEEHDKKSHDIVGDMKHRIERLEEAE